LFVVDMEVVEMEVLEMEVAWMAVVEKMHFGLLHVDFSHVWKMDVGIEHEMEAVCSSCRSLWEW